MGWILIQLRVIGLPAPAFWLGYLTLGLVVLGLLPSICWITVGGIGRKREDVDGQITTRDDLSLTVSFDHNMMDAAPGARFTERFKELIESGYGLTLEEEATSARRPQPQVV